MKKTCLILVLAAGGAWAQGPDGPVLMQHATTMIGPIGMAGAMATVTGAPYTADAVTERVQPLPDGNRIVQSSRSFVARDSQGRTRREESLALALPGSSGPAPKIVMIQDPVSLANWSLDMQTKTALKVPAMKSPSGLKIPANPLPAPGPEHTFFYSSGTPGAQVTIQTMERRAGEDEPKPVRADLGTQTIEGVLAQGTRFTRTLPAGAVGNEQPLTIVSESWYSPDLHVIVMSKSDDPRMGQTSYRLTNIQRSEPSPSLFEVPADFTVRDQPTNMMFTRELPRHQ